MFLRILGALADGIRNFVGLTQSGADVSFAITDNNHGAETEPAAALDDLGDPVDTDHALICKL
jgi:hypothetical protein